MQIPVTNNFSNDLNGVLGQMQLSEDAYKMINELIEAGVIPTFAVGFVGKPDENGVYTEVELKEVSMITEPHDDESRDNG